MNVNWHPFRQHAMLIVLVFTIILLLTASIAQAMSGGSNYFVVCDCRDLGTVVEPLPPQDEIPDSSGLPTGTKIRLRRFPLPQNGHRILLTRYERYLPPIGEEYQQIRHADGAVAV